MLLNCGVGEDSFVSLGQKKIQPVHPKGNLSWIFIGKTDAEAETPILWPLDAEHWLIGKDPDGGKDWRREASPTPWTGVWVNSGSWWWTGRPGVLQAMGLPRFRHEWVTHLKWFGFSPFIVQSITVDRRYRTTENEDVIVYAVSGSFLNSNRNQWHAVYSVMQADGSCFASS